MDFINGKFELFNIYNLFIFISFFIPLHADYGNYFEFKNSM